MHYIFAHFTCCGNAWEAWQEEGLKLWDVRGPPKATLQDTVTATIEIKWGATSYGPLLSEDSSSLLRP